VLPVAPPLDPAMHILVLPAWFPEPGRPEQARFFVDQARALVEAGHEVGVIYPALRRLADSQPWRRPFAISQRCQDELPVLQSHGIHVPRGGVLNPCLLAQQALRLYLRYRAQHGRPDVIHAQCSMWSAWGAALIAARHAVPFVVTEHWSGFLEQPLHGWRRAAVRFGLSRASAVLAVSRALANVLRPLNRGRAVEVLPNMVDLAQFLPQQRTAAASGMRVLCLGNLIRRKRFDLAIDAFARAFGADPSCQLEIGGEGPEAPELRARAHASGLGARVVFLGALSRSEVAAVLQRADLLVSSSDSETFGVVLIEALASGVPVIATRSGGPDDIVTPEVGYLSMPGDVAGLADAMRAARLRWNIEGPNWGGHCREYATRRYGSVEFARRLGQILRRAIDEQAHVA
jgi:teichuronic acid biosynthesis glycosyltransferase TuaC